MPEIGVTVVSPVATVTVDESTQTVTVAGPTPSVSVDETAVTIAETSTPVSVGVEAVNVTVRVDAATVNVGVGSSGPQGPSGTITFEGVSDNLVSVDYDLTYSSGELTSITYDNGIVKTLGYSGDRLVSVALSGATPAGIELTKTFTYTGDDLTGVSYS